MMSLGDSRLSSAGRGYLGEDSSGSQEKLMAVALKRGGNAPSPPFTRGAVIAASAISL